MTAMIASTTTPPTTPPTIAPVLVLPESEESCFLSAAVYASTRSGRSKNAGVKSPDGHVAGTVALQGFDLQHPQKESPPVHDQKLLAAPQEASGKLPHCVLLKAPARILPWKQPAELHGFDVQHPTKLLPVVQAYLVNVSPEISTVPRTGFYHEPPSGQWKS